MATTFAVSADVREILARCDVSRSPALGSAPPCWKLRLPAERFAPKRYRAVNKVLEAAGGKWSRADAAHVFERDPREVLELAVETGVAANVKQALQAFYTPAPVVEEVIRLAEIERHHRVLEPSAGTGAIASAIPVGRHDQVQCFEIDPVSCSALVALGFEDAQRVDFLRVPGEPVFDRVVMNPPFSRGAAAEHVRHAYGFLKPGGVLVSVVPYGVKATRTELQERFEALLVEGRAERFRLPNDAFVESGTRVLTEILRLRRPLPRARRRA